MSWIFFCFCLSYAVEVSRNLLLACVHVYGGACARCAEARDLRALVRAARARAFVRSRARLAMSLLCIAFARSTLLVLLLRLVHRSARRRRRFDRCRRARKRSRPSLCRRRSVGRSIGARSIDARSRRRLILSRCRRRRAPASTIKVHFVFRTICIVSSKRV